MKPELVISSLNNLSNLNSLGASSSNDRVIVNKNEKSIVVNEGGKISTVTGNKSQAQQDGYLLISAYPNDIILQWGRANLTANSSKTFNFPLEFPNGPFNITATHQTNSPPVTVMADAISKNQFTISIDGGEDGENVNWFAIGC